jgi:Na+/proline symporter
MAFFELAPYFGFWLFWTVATTSLGLLMVRLVARRIWIKLQDYDHRPTLHEFLGSQFGSSSVALIGAICTSMGFLGAFAVELTVGSRFLAGLVPVFPTWIVVLILASVGLIYTAAGGFRAVIVTDIIQIFSIWITLIALPVFYLYYLVSHGGWEVNFSNVPREVVNFSHRDGLESFLIGIFVINVPTFISDMSVWQRIAGSQEPKTVMRGLWSSVISAGTTWGMFVLIACLSLMFIKPTAGTNLLLILLDWIGANGGHFGLIIIFLSVLGLYGANLSTASTQLIAVAHTLYEDVISRFSNKAFVERVASKRELSLTRILLICSTIVSITIVEFLSLAGFSIADLVFAIYGAQLCLFPPVLFALFCKKATLGRLSNWVIASLVLGFVSGWATAVLGKISNNGDIVFLAPVASLLLSSTILLTGLFWKQVLSRRFE